MAVSAGRLQWRCRFTVLEVALLTIQTHSLIRGGSDEFGGGTGAALVNDELWVGSFHGDRVARYPLPSVRQRK